MGLEDMDVFNPTSLKAETVGEEALEGDLDTARKILNLADSAKDRPASTTRPLPGDAETLRWFPLPEEIRRELLTK